MATMFTDHTKILKKERKKTNKQTIREERALREERAIRSAIISVIQEWEGSTRYCRSLTLVHLQWICL